MLSLSCLFFKLTDILDRAHRAARLPGDADIAPVQDQPVMGVAAIGAGHDLE